MVYSVASPGVFGGLSPDIVERVGVANGRAETAVRVEGAEAEGFAGPFAGAGAAGAGGVGVTIVSAPDPDREVEDVARRVRERIDGGCEASRIAVVARSARPYVDRVVDALAKYGVPATARRRHAFAEIPVVRALLSLFRVAAEGWTRHGLVELAEQPYFGRHSRGAAQTPMRRLDPVILNHIGYRRRIEGLDAWTRAHDALRQRAERFEARVAEGEGERWGRDAPPSSARVAEAATFFRRFAEQARELERPRPLRAWVDWLNDFLENDPWKIELHVFKVPEDRYDVARLDAAGLGGIRGIVRQWHDALETWGVADDAPLDVAAFESRLREMLSGDAALWTFTRRAVHVSEALAAAQRGFDHVFIVGLAGDGFPRRAPRSPVFDEHDRRGLREAGLPLDVRDTWDLRERELFRVLVAGASRSLTLCFPRTDEQGRELAPSAFLEETAIALHDRAPSRLTIEKLKRSDVVPASLPLVTDAEAAAFAVHAATIERDRRTGRLSPYNGLIEAPALRAWVADKLDEHRVWSPTQLESYAKCPWAWFSQRLLRLEHLDDPDIDIDPIARGSILHDAMRRFYLLAQTLRDGPVFLRKDDRDWIPRYLEQVLNEAVDAAGPGAWLGMPSLRQTKQEEMLRMLLRYVEWEIEHDEKMYNRRTRSFGILRTGVVEHELAFGMPGLEDEYDVVEIERAGVRFRVRGSVDRVERGIDERLPEAERERFIAAVDYKTSKWSAPGGGDKTAWDDGVVLQVPLYAHVLERLRPGSRVARVEYRAFKQPGVQHSLELYRIEKNSGLTEVEAAVEKMATALDDAGRHVARARTGEFPAHPAPSCACPPFCHALDVCRVAMGPRSGREVDAEWKRVAAQIRGGRSADAAAADGAGGASGDDAPVVDGESE